MIRKTSEPQEFDGELKNEYKNLRKRKYDHSLLYKAIFVLQTILFHVETV